MEGGGNIWEEERGGGRGSLLSGRACIYEEECSWALPGRRNIVEEMEHSDVYGGEEGGGPLGGGDGVYGCWNN